MLELKNLYFTIADHEKSGGIRNIIDGINYAFDDGKFYAITGPNGSGKTSLAKLIMGINPVTKGSIVYDGTEISALTITERARAGIAYSFQQPARFKGITFRDLLTIATGFDKDFEGLHPKRLRRIILGPMYSASFTLQSGPISKVLEGAKAPEGEDWALVWTVEDLVSDREEEVKDGWFSTATRQVYKLDPVAGAELGATRQDRMIILPEKPYQVLVEQNPKGLQGLRKFVVGAGGRLIPTL